MADNFLRKPLSKKEAAEKFLSDKQVNAMVPMFVDKDKPDDHKCSTCKFRVMPNTCAIVKGPVSMENGTCSWWAEGSAMDEVRDVQMSYELSGYIEVPPNSKINCSTCRVYKSIDENTGDCTLWQAKVKAGQCCMVWDNDKAKVPNQESNEKK